MQKKVLVLGGGWSGLHLAAEDKERYIVTNRSEEKVKNSPVPSVLFDVENQSTWDNLTQICDNAEVEVVGIVITFALSTALLGHCKELLEKLVEKKKVPIVVLSTSSVFRSHGYLDTVTEDHTMDGLGVFGNPLTDRVAAEQELIDSGNLKATVLHLSGLVEDHSETNDNVRSILAMFKKGYMKKPAYPVVNLIHIRDIIHVVKTCLAQTSCNGLQWNGERIIVSSGAYRYGDLKRGVNLEPALEETVPIEDEGSFKTSKVLSVRKLLGFIGETYEFLLPVANILPVSKGLPSIRSPHPYESTGIAHDRQFSLMKTNFSGKWRGDTSWYKRKDENVSNKDMMLTLQQFYDLIGNTLVFNFPPTQIIKGSQYHIYMTDADNGIWHGTGLRFATNGGKKIPLSRPLYNSTGGSFQFPNMGSQISSSTSEPVFAWEANFFCECERSMIIIMYKLLSPEDEYLEMESVGIAPFRCALEHSQPSAPVRRRKNLSSLLEDLDSMQGKAFWRSYQYALDEDGEMIPVGTKTESVEMLCNPTNYPDRLVQSFDDGIFCSMPLKIRRGSACKVIIGCRHTESFLQVCTVTYSSDGNVDRYHLEQYRRTDNVE